MNTGNRRPLKTRGAGWAKGLARGLAATGLTPNAISSIGIGFAALGAWYFLGAMEHNWMWLAAAACIQLRLLANMLDGLVAVEEGRSSPTGALFNEVPDRIEDALLLVAAGYSIGEPALGYGATILAFGTAYLRANGGALGFEQDFVGPMAKQHRMFVLTIGAVAAFFLTTREAMIINEKELAMGVALLIIAAGAAVTCVVRTWRIAKLLKAKAAEDAEA